MAKHAIIVVGVLAAASGIWWYARGGAARRHAHNLAADIVDGEEDFSEGTVVDSLVNHVGDADPDTGINSNKAMPLAISERRRYIHSVVAEIKSKMGTPTDTAANRLVVRRMAHDIMREHGMRYTAIKVAIEHTIESVFKNDRYEMEAKEWSAMVGDRSKTTWSLWWDRTTRSSAF